jgi:hypothetical protein
MPLRTKNPLANYSVVATLRNATEPQTYPLNKKNPITS